MDPELGIPAEIISSPADKTEGCYKASANPTEPLYFRKLVEATISNREAKYRYGFLSFDVLHKLILLNHQHKLAQHVRDVVSREINDEEQLRRIDEDLHAYRMWENRCNFCGLVF